VIPPGPRASSGRGLDVVLALLLAAPLVVLAFLLRGDVWLWLWVSVAWMLLWAALWMWARRRWPRDRGGPGGPLAG
jgi:uncharacterized membrane protein